MTCTFFGHRDCPETVRTKLTKVIEELIVNNQVDRFYVGNHGRFDNYVISALESAKTKHPHIDYCVVLAYMPNSKTDTNNYETMLPDGIEYVPMRFAISYGNKWMLAQSEYVVTYITKSYGGAVKFAEVAKKSKKICINIA